jgi:hypothetical protein
MNLSEFCFTKCRNCQRYSLSSFPFAEPFGQKERQILEWECPYCLDIISEEEWKKNIISELPEDFEKKESKDNLRRGIILKYSSGEISPKAAKELAVEYIRNLKTDYPPSFQNIRISDSGEEWWADFNKISPRGLNVIPATYCVVINKKTGEANIIS